MYKEWVNGLLHMEMHCMETRNVTSPPPSLNEWMGWTGPCDLTRIPVHLTWCLRTEWDIIIHK